MTDTTPAARLAALMHEALANVAPGDAVMLNMLKIDICMEEEDFEELLEHVDPDLEVIPWMVNDVVLWITCGTDIKRVWLEHCAWLHTSVQGGDPETAMFMHAANVVLKEYIEEESECELPVYTAPLVN